MPSLSDYGTGTESWLRPRWSTASSRASRRESCPELRSPTTWDRTPPSSIDAFCRAYALALAKSPDQDGLIAFRELLDAAVDELRLHQGYAPRWDVDLHQAADTATAAYTHFLLAVAAFEPVGHIAAAMTPCMRLYGYLGQQLAARTTPESPYREWVMTYSSAQFEALARRLEVLLDRYKGDHDRLAVVLYQQAMDWNCGSSMLPADGRSHDCG